MRTREAMSGGPVARGFTIVELLVVIAIIVILLSILLAVSARVFAGQKAASTRNVMTTLDRMLDEYITATGTVPRYRPEAWAGRPSEFLGLLGDPLETVPTGPEEFSLSGPTRPHVRRPEVGVFLDQVAGYGAVDSLLEGLPPQFVRSFELPGAGFGGQNTGDLIRRTIVDAWAEEGEEWEAVQGGQRRYPMAGAGSVPLIYFVHPENALAQELYGRCQGGRPYFLSAGADGRYGLGGGVELAEGATQREVEGGLSDNITSYPVGPANLTGAFFTTRNQTR